MKAEVRISSKDYNRNKGLKLLPVRPTYPSRASDNVVAQICNLQALDGFKISLCSESCRMQFGDTADCKSALPFRRTLRAIWDIAMHRKQRKISAVFASLRFNFDLLTRLRLGSAVFFTPLRLD
jgi:hypothetical protein